MVYGTLVDWTVLLDLFTADPVWRAWSLDALAHAADAGPLLINPIIYAEVSAHFSTIEELEATLPANEFGRAPLPWDAAFLASKVHLTYRRNGGSRSSTLPDFLIGAHAAVVGLRLLTRDVRRYRTYFPTVELHAPD